MRRCAVIVPSTAAADQLRRTLENHVLAQNASSDRAVCLPHIVTRAGWYDGLHSRMASPPRRLGDLEREVLLKAAARATADSENSAPFRVRAGLLVQMLALYDDLRRRNMSIDTFERLVAGDLETRGHHAAFRTVCAGGETRDGAQLASREDAGVVTRGLLGLRLEPQEWNHRVHLSLLAMASSSLPSSASHPCFAICV